MTGNDTAATARNTCSAGGCGNPSPDAAVCTGCIDQLRRDLAAISGRRGEAGLAGELLVTMCRQDVTDGAHGVREAGLDPEPTDQPIGETGLPLDLPAAEVLAGLRDSLSSWVRYLLEQPTSLPGAQWPGPRPATLARWLGRHLLTIAADPAGGQLVDDVARDVQRARSVVFPAAPLEYAGPCGHCDCASPRGCPTCTAPTHPASVHLYVARGAVQVICPVCPRSWRVEDRRAWLLERCEDQLVTATEASRALPGLVGDRLVGRSLTVHRIRGWARRGQVAEYRPHPKEWSTTADGKPVRPAPRFLVRELLEVLAAGA